MTYEDFELMQISARNAFETTLRTWGMSEKQIDKFAGILDRKDGYKAIGDSLAEAIEWEEE